MHKVVKVIGTEKRREFVITYVILDDGSEASGVGKLGVGDKVEGPWWDEALQKARIKKYLL